MLRFTKEVQISKRTSKNPGRKVPSKLPKPLQKNLRLRRKKAPPKIVIDTDAGFVFESEDELFRFFQDEIEHLESEYESYAKNDEDWDDSEVVLEDELDKTLDEPTEIWHDTSTFQKFPIFHFVRALEKHNAFHVAVCYVSSEDEPTFVFLHFVTQDLDLVGHYRRGELVYDRAYEEVGFAMLEGDSISEGDPTAMGLFIAMLKLRSEKDVSYDQFQALGDELREETIEAADEIWRSTDGRGQRIVSFIKEFSDHPISDMHYIAVTLEDASTHVHNLLFSFPTTDLTLVDRYRHGENLQAEEVTQESSH